MIYKKSILPCPLPFMLQHHNMSMNGSGPLGSYTLHNGTGLMDFSRANLDPHAPVSASHGASSVHYEPHPEDLEEMCTPKYFVFNSQVCLWCV